MTGPGDGDDAFGDIVLILFGVVVLAAVGGALSLHGQEWVHAAWEHVTAWFEDVFRDRLATLPHTR